ncbi:MAG: DUF1491 family protein [Pseudomonadota bacterium]|nr:DUF1491 family protein [Pseudomonadota bacterium]
MTLPSGILVSAMIRRANDSGGFGVVLAKGHPQAGAILLVVSEFGVDYRVLERGIGRDGRIALIDSTPPDDVTGYWRRRRLSDPDLWVIELTSPDAERFAAETILDD